MYDLYVHLGCIEYLIILIFSAQFLAIMNPVNFDSDD